MTFNKSHLRDYLPFYLAALLTLTPWISSPIALIIGFALASFGFVPTTFSLGKITKKLLAYSIVGLGFGIQLNDAIEATSNGIIIILSTIIGTLLLGWLLVRIMKLDKVTGHLIASGTAICGGSAIAAVAPAIDADDEAIGFALATVFVLNSIALFIFPAIGHALELSQQTFGTWAAIAIHDTSSVVGAASAYGEEALKVATTLKLARALWIIPVALVSALLFKNSNRKITIPYFIFFYCLAILINDNLPQFNIAYNAIFELSKKLLVLCLFLIGCSISIEKIKSAGAKPLIFGVILWIAISTSSLFYIINYTA